MQQVHDFLDVIVDVTIGLLPRCRRIEWTGDLREGLDAIDRSDGNGIIRLVHNIEFNTADIAEDVAKIIIQTVVHLEVRDARALIVGRTPGGDHPAYIFFGRIRREPRFEVALPRADMGIIDEIEQVVRLAVRQPQLTNVQSNVFDEVADQLPGQVVQRITHGVPGGRHHPDEGLQGAGEFENLLRRLAILHDLFEDVADDELEVLDVLVDDVRGFTFERVVVAGQLVDPGLQYRICRTQPGQVLVQHHLHVVELRDVDQAEPTPQQIADHAVHLFDLVVPLSDQLPVGVDADPHGAVRRVGVRGTTRRAAVRLFVVRIVRTAFAGFRHGVRQRQPALTALAVATALFQQTGEVDGLHSGDLAEDVEEGQPAVITSRR